MVQNIKRVKRELVREGVIVNMYTDFMEMPDGRIAEWDFIEHKKGAAAVVAVLPDGNILMVRQYRNALDRVTLEIPAGARDSVTEDTAICAKRELEEETGYTCGKLEKLLSLKSMSIWQRSLHLENSIWMKMSLSISKPVNYPDYVKKFMPGKFRMRRP